MRHDLGAEKRSAVATTIDSFKEEESKVRALSDPNMRFVPLLWLQWMASFWRCPSCGIGWEDNRSYRPYLLGQRGSCILNQYFGMQQMLPSWRINKLYMLSHPGGLVKVAMSQQHFSSILMETSWPVFWNINLRIKLVNMQRLAYYSSSQM